MTVWTGDAPGGRQIGPYLVAVLRSLGYRVRLKLITPADYFATVGDSRNKVQIGPAGWTADYASASDFFGPLLTCASFKPGTKNGNSNYGAFCNRRIDIEIARAQSLQVTDQSAASALWAKIDHEIVDLAPWIVRPSPSQADFLSSRVGNYTYSLQWGALLDQLWVR